MTLAIRRMRSAMSAAEFVIKHRRKLLRDGWERALIYKTMVLTGLRKGELASLTVGQFNADAGGGPQSLDSGLG